MRSLAHAARMLAAWNNIGVRRDDVMLVINRSGAKFKEAISVQDFERVSHRKIDAFINNDIKAVTQAENNARTLFEADNDGQIQQQIGDLARSIIVRHYGEEALAAQNGLSKKSLFSFNKLKKK